MVSIVVLMNCLFASGLYSDCGHKFNNATVFCFFFYSFFSKPGSRHIFHLCFELPQTNLVWHARQSDSFRRANWKEVELNSASSGGIHQKCI